MHSSAETLCRRGRRTRVGTETAAAIRCGAVLAAPSRRKRMMSITRRLRPGWRSLHCNQGTFPSAPMVGPYSMIYDPFFGYSSN
jgi:hypothetical protein